MPCNQSLAAMVQPGQFSSAKPMKSDRRQNPSHTDVIFGASMKSDSPNSELYTEFKRSCICTSICKQDYRFSLPMVRLDNEVCPYLDSAGDDDSQVLLGFPWHFPVAQLVCRTVVNWPTKAPHSGPGGFRHWVTHSAEAEQFVLMHRH